MPPSDLCLPLQSSGTYLSSSCFLINIPSLQPIFSFFAFYLFTDYRCPVRTESLPRHYRCPVHIYLGNTDVLSVMQAYLDTTDVLSVRSGSLPGDNRCPILCTLVETYCIRGVRFNMLAFLSNLIAAKTVWQAYDFQSYIQYMKV